MAAAMVLFFPIWRDDPDYSHGWFTPALGAWLLINARRMGPIRWLEPSGSRRPMVMILLGGGLVALLLGALYAVAVGVTHALVLNFFTLALLAGWSAALVLAASSEVRLIPLNWIALTALILWGLSMPLPPGTYSRLSLGLQFALTEKVILALHWIGIPAMQSGNVIDLGRTSVGVEAACSGVRSLISCIYAGFFFSAHLIRRPAGRVLVLILAPLLAIGMNFIRSLGLTLLAYKGVDISGAWHDLTGLAILVVTAAVLLLVATRFDHAKTNEKSAAGPAVTLAVPSGKPAGRYLLLSGVGLATLIVIAFMGVTSTTRIQTTVTPDLATLLPAAEGNWRVETAQGLYRFSDVLQTEHLFQRTYLHRDDEGLKQVTIYVAYWPAGTAPVSLVASHTPDACWPGTGWATRDTESKREALRAGGVPLPPAESRVFLKDDISRHVWFWHYYGGEIVEDIDPRSPFNLIGNVLRHGVRSQGDQIFLRISSNRSWSELEDEPLLADVFQRLARLGV